MDDNGVGINGGNKKKLATLGFKTVNAFAKDEYDLSPYLHRDDRQIPKDTPRAPYSFLEAEQRLGALNPSIRAMGQENSPEVKSELNDVNACKCINIRSSEINGDYYEAVEEAKGKVGEDIFKCGLEKICHMS